MLFDDDVRNNGCRLILRRWREERTMSELNLSMAEAVILQMGLRVLTQGDIKKTDRLIAEELDRKIRIAYKGQRIRLVLFGENEE